MIAASAAEFMPSVDWVLWRAQIMQESAGRVNAVSPVGAMGLAQVMPATFADITRQSGIVGNPFDPMTNLRAGAFYMNRMRGIFKAPRPEIERHNLAMASYNAGAGNIIRAQRLVGNPPDWAPVAAVLPQVTGHHAAETQQYVIKIRRYYAQFKMKGL